MRRRMNFNMPSSTLQLLTYRRTRIRSYSSAQERHRNFKEEKEELEEGEKKERDNCNTFCNKPCSTATKRFLLLCHLQDRPVC
jgi:hypothetical protein